MVQNFDGNLSSLTQPGLPRNSFKRFLSNFPQQRNETDENYSARIKSTLQAGADLYNNQEIRSDLRSMSIARHGASDGIWSGSKVITIQNMDNYLNNN